MSEQLIERLVDHNNIDLEADDIRFVQSLVKGEPISSRTEKRFLYDIVTNNRSLLDVDKIDYLQRDCHYVGLSNDIHTSRLIERIRVIDDEICRPEDEARNVMNAFKTRFMMQKAVYSSPQVRAHCRMTLEVMALADKYYDFERCVHSHEMYLALDDSLMDNIALSTQPKLAEARALVKRLEGEPYETVLGMKFPQHVARKVKDLNLFDAIRTDVLGLHDSQVCLVQTTASYGAQNQNPLEKMKFYSNSKPDEAYYLKDAAKYADNDGVFEEKYLYVICKDKSMKSLVKGAFLNHARRTGFGVCADTPSLRQNLPMAHLSNQFARTMTI